MKTSLKLLLILCLGCSCIHRGKPTSNDDASRNSTASVAEKSDANSLPVEFYIGMKYKDNLSDIPNSKNIWYSARLAKLLNIKDTIFYWWWWESLTIEGSDYPHIGASVFSVKKDMPVEKCTNCIVVESYDGTLSTLIGAIKAPAGISISLEGVSEESSEFCHIICLGVFTVEDQVEMDFEIREMYGVPRRNGFVTKLPLSTKLSCCPVPRNHQDPDNESTPYYFYVKGGEKQTNSY